MEYNTEVLLRIWMAARAGEPERAIELLEHRLKHLAPRSTGPLEVRLPVAA
jgi:hypothetical protein